MIPFTTSPYRVDPRPDISDQIGPLLKILQYHRQRLRAAPVEYRHAGLDATLESLTDRLMQGEPADAPILQLLYYNVYGTAAPGDAGTKLSGHVRYFARLVVRELLPPMGQRVVQLARVVWKSLQTQMSPYGDGPRMVQRRLALSVFELARVISTVNIPESYELLAEVLRHDWAEARDVAAACLKHWHSDTLAEEARSALWSGIDDPIAWVHCSYLVQLVRLTSGPEARRRLEDLLSAGFRSDYLRRVIESMGDHAIQKRG